MNHPFDSIIDIVKERLRQRLAARPPQLIVDASRVPSAVLIPIFQKETEYHILFIQRSPNVHTHKGQIAFPGGTYRESDRNLLDTALRESFEEIALRCQDVEVLGQMDDQVSVSSGFVISPFLGIIPYPYPFRVDGSETEGTLESPIAALAAEGHFHEEIAIQDSGVVTDFYYHCGGRIIWGATARILNDVLDLFALAGSASVNT